MPGIEFEIKNQHILGININEEIKEADSFEKLKNIEKLIQIVLLSQLTLIFQEKM